MAAKPERPKVRTSCGVGKCLFCRSEFERARAWSKFCSAHCRMMHWHTLHRRKSQPGFIVAVDGVRLEQPVPVIDTKLKAEVEKRVEAEMAYNRSGSRGASSSRRKQRPAPDGRVYAYIVKQTGYCAGRAAIDGTQVPVMSVAFLWNARKTVSQIRAFYPGLSEAQVHAALCYYYDHKDEIEADLRLDEQSAEQVEDQKAEA